jgi:hypothetical protein
VIFPMFFAS